MVSSDFPISNLHSPAWVAIIPAYLEVHAVPIEANYGSGVVGVLVVMGYHVVPHLRYALPCTLLHPLLEGSSRDKLFVRWGRFAGWGEGSGSR